MNDKAIEETIAARVSVHMQVQDWTQKELAGVLDTTQPAISVRLAGKARFTAAELYRLSIAFNVPIGNLFPK